MQDVLHLWKANKKPLSVYIHSPFCKTTCSYCVYRGTVDNSCVNDYYESYLPRMIGFYKEVLASSDVQIIYYGGGTPTLYLDKLVEATVDLRTLQPKEIILEIHSGLSIDYDLIKQLGTTTAILCQQTFDKNQLGIWNRFGYLSSGEFEARVSTLHSMGIKVGCDFITCESTESDIARILAMKDLPDEISIAPLYQGNRLAEVYNLAEFLSEVGFYEKYSPLHSLDLKNASALKNLKVLRFFRKDLNLPVNPTLEEYSRFPFFTFLQSQDDILQAYEATTSILGIGSLNNPDKGTFSKINDDFIYYENWNGSSLYPEFIITKHKSFFDQAREVIDWLELQAKDAGIPAGLQLTLTNKSYDGDFVSTYRKNANHDLCWFEVRHPSKNNRFIQQVQSQISNFIGKSS